MATPATVGRPVTYRNYGDAPVTLELTATTHGWSGAPVPGRVVSPARGPSPPGRR
ncbi:MAG: hypothetical protein FWJ70_15895 [Micromonosporaceae bacterium]